MVTMILALAMGQCAGGSCPTRQSFSYPAAGGWLPVSTPLFRLAGTEQAKQKVVRKYAWHWVKFDGLNVQVWGFVLADGKIEWEPELKENAAQLAKARERANDAATKAAEPKPDAVAPEKPAGDRPISGMNFGVDASHLGDSNAATRYTSNAPVAAAAMIDDKVVGDSTQDKFYLTVIGDKEDRSAVKSAFDSQDWAAMRDQVWFGEFDRGAWQVNDALGYHADNGKPTVLLQSPSGRVLYRANDFSAGSEPIIQALRKADPNYRPDNDPGPSRKPKGNPDSVFTPGRCLAAGVAVLVLLVLLPQRKQ